MRQITEKGALVSEPLAVPPPPSDMQDIPPLICETEEDDSNNSFSLGFVTPPNVPPQN